ncbi:MULTISPECIES: AsmA-like C-terminal region-containing protein [unclassified Bradyrhizobium]|uniref:AsmA family protein n=1 Tax=unclassified Bradyrhizobium TaxID=2631580 RepID=UPI002478971E|nr:MULTISPECIES: AsmA-like C-terminal region-containing protein [unclassified Bradyrhizobium]WGS22401.1 AsmA family protein [Bradyrhizobium sp. ISRA463]WGS29377.1 AsmA family protein [Bradyrhizobium sp. ISRA464]
MQTTLLGLAIAFILALVAALVGPYFVDWNQFRPQFEEEATKIIGAPVRVAGDLDARLLPAPSLRLNNVTVGGANDLGKVRAGKLDVEFSLSSLMRGEWRATELTINGVSLDLGLDPKGRIDWPVSSGTFNLASLAIDRLNLTGRIALHDAASRSTLELSDIAFSGDVRSLAGSIRGDGNFMFGGNRYPFRVSSGPLPDGNGTRLHVGIDPGQRPLSADLDGVLTFEARAPRFEGTVALASAPSQRGRSDEPPWRIAGKVKADHSAARLDQVEVSYGAEDRALKLAGSGDVRFGAEPLLRASLSARQLDADKFVAKDASDSNAEPAHVLPTLRAVFSGLTQSPIPAQIELASEQIMLGGRPLQDVSAELQSDAKSWMVRRLEFRAPGSTRVSMSGGSAQSGTPNGFKTALDIESSDPDALMVWLQGRGDIAYRSQKPLRLRGDVSVSPAGFAIDALRAELEGGTLEGRVAVSHREATKGSKVEAQLKADQLDFDATAAFVRSLLGPQAEWPDEARLSLDVGRAISAGQEFRPLLAKIAYSPKDIVLERLKIGQADNVTLDSSGNFDRVNSTGKLAIDATAASLGRIAAMVQPFAPSLAARLGMLRADAGPVRAKLALDLGKGKGQAADRTTAQATLDLEAPQVKGRTVISATPPVAAIRGLDLNALGRSDIAAEAKFSAGEGSALLALLGLDHAIAAGAGPAQFEGTVSGAWRAPLRVKARLWGAGLDADAEGTAEPWAKDAKSNLSLRVRSADISPLLDLKSSDQTANIRLSSRVSLVGDKLTFDDLDSIVAGSRLRGHLALTLADEKSVEGELGLDQITLAPIFATAIGAAGHDATAPLGAVSTKGWRGKVTFEALRGVLPGGAELQPVSGTLRSDGQSLTFDRIKGKIGGGEATASIDARQGVNGLALNANVQLSNVDGSALRYRNLAMPKGRASMQMTLLTQGRSTSALMGALSGSGTVTLEGMSLPGLDPRAFDVAIRASDSGQATDDARLKQIVEPVLAGGALPIASAQIPFNIRDGRIRVGATTLAASGANATVSGGYDIPADQADIRAALASTQIGTANSRPEIQLLAVGTPDGLTRSVDIAALSSWLAVRAIDRETRRLDAIERGDPPPSPDSVPSAIPQPAIPSPDAPNANPAALSPADVPLPGRDPRRLLAPKPKIVAPPRPPAATAPAVAPPAPIASQSQVAPLPPPIEVKPPPGTVKPKLRPPLSLTPQVANPPPRPAMQN